MLTTHSSPKILVSYCTIDQVVTIWDIVAKRSSSKIDDRSP